MITSIDGYKRVEDELLSALYAAYYRSYEKLPMVAVDGTAGRSPTEFQLWRLLPAQGFTKEDYLRHEKLLLSESWQEAASAYDSICDLDPADAILVRRYDEKLQMISFEFISKSLINQVIVSLSPDLLPDLLMSTEGLN